VRRLALGAVLGVLVLTGCSGDDGGADMLSPGDDQPRESSVAVDTPELRALKAEAGIDDCAPGPGGGSLPAVTVACLGGGTPVDLSTLRGPLVINLWQSTCKPCEQEMPILQAFHEQYGERVAVLGIDSTDVRPGTALELLGQRGVTYPQLADPDGDLQETSVFAKVRAYPHLTLVDADGEVAYEKAGAVLSAEELEALVEEHLGVDL
jgi:thiol-disulfide isomerase/thioredoxin